MFERCTERARRTVFWARYFASQVGSPEIETEHLLLGLLREDMGLAQRFLGSPWALEEVWGRVSHSNVAGEKTSGCVDLPLSKASTRVLAFAMEEADKLSSKPIGTVHLLLGLLRETNSTAGAILRDRGIRIESVRDELVRIPHDESVKEEFVRKREPLPEDIVEVQNRIRSLQKSVNAAIAEHDFAKAQALSEDERKERDRLYLLCQQHGLSEWLYE